MSDPATFTDLVRFHVSQQNRRPRGFSFLPTKPRVECAWCRAVISQGAEPVSHGICPACREQHFPKEAAKDGR